ncbi:hypothetical protein [Pelagibaculum spongiae]|uniref:Uncharacterized protein n=1 Tax=Pelagibaculum spongiae TaxID=2080658 RepID=A0A2V1H1W2_9GAMM|nr:hypothetical protein [Pelagibaculum spongiae]PVZ69670.1 hypothetical protein DC094_10230 [Pelagibaculum spongiae]
MKYITAMLLAIMLAATANASEYTYPYPSLAPNQPLFLALPWVGAKGTAGERPNSLVPITSVREIDCAILDNPDNNPQNAYSIRVRVNTTEQGTGGLHDTWVSSPAAGGTTIGLQFLAERGIFSYIYTSWIGCQKALPDVMEAFGFRVYGFDRD